MALCVFCSIYLNFLDLKAVCSSVHWSTNLKAVSLSSCGFCCFALLAARWQVILGECPWQVHTVRKQCNNIA